MVSFNLTQKQDVINWIELWGEISGKMKIFFTIKTQKWTLKVQIWTKKQAKTKKQKLKQNFKIIDIWLGVKSYFIEFKVGIKFFLLLLLLFLLSSNFHIHDSHLHLDTRNDILIFFQSWMIMIINSLSKEKWKLWHKQKKRWRWRWAYQINCLKRLSWKWILVFCENEGKKIITQRNKRRVKMKSHPHHFSFNNRLMIW